MVKWVKILKTEKMKLSRGSGDPVGTGRILEKLTCEAVECGLF